MYFEIIWNDNDILNIDIFVKIEFNVLCSWRDLKDVTKFYFSVECRKFLRKIDSKRKFIKSNNSCNGEKTGEILIVNNDSNSQKNRSLHFNVGNNHHFFFRRELFYIILYSQVQLETKVLDGFHDVIRTLDIMYLWYSPL